MKKPKICVYAIAKNEEKFAARRVKSMSETDSITVLDTESTDKTVEILSFFPLVTVHKKNISPWRFDTARNESPALVPQDADYCVCTDLDEVFEVGRRNALEKAILSSPDKVSYRYIWDFNPDGSEKTVFNIEKIHRRNGFNGLIPYKKFLNSLKTEHRKRHLPKAFY